MFILLHHTWYIEWPWLKLLLLWLPADHVLLASHGRIQQAAKATYLKEKPHLASYSNTNPLLSFTYVKTMSYLWWKRNIQKMFIISSEKSIYLGIMYQVHANFVELT